MRQVADARKKAGNAAGAIADLDLLGSHDAPSSVLIERLIQSEASRTLRPVASVACLAYFGLALLHLILLPESYGWIMALVAALTGVVLLVLAVQSPVPRQRAHLLTTATAVLMLSNGMLHLVLSADVTQTTNLLLLLLAAGSVLLVTSHMTALIAIVCLGWLAIVSSLQEVTNLAHWASAMVICSLLTATIQWTRAQSLKRTAGLRVEHWRQNQELTEALHVADDTRERLQLAMDGANEGLWDWDLREDALRVSARWKELLGLPRGDTPLEIDTWFNRVHPADKERLEQEIAEHLAGETEFFDCSHRLVHANGQYRWVRARGLAIRGENETSYRFAGSLGDAAEVTHDRLTGLPTKALLLSHLENRLSSAKRSENKHDACVLCLQFGGFDNARFTLGPVATDELVVKISERLAATFRVSDLVSHASPLLGLSANNRFIILLDQTVDREVITAVTDRLVATFSTPIQVGENEVSLLPQVGALFADSEEDDPRALLESAALASDHAAEGGKAGITIFDESMASAAKISVALQAALRASRQDSGLSLVYQPIVALEDRSALAFEALIRWHHDDLGSLMPGDFIPIAERSSLIEEVDRWVLRTACEEVHALELEHDSELGLHVNISARHLSNGDLPGSVSAALDSSGYRARSLVLEITESLLVDRTPVVDKVLTELEEMGIRIAIDDFGSGYWSLAQLRECDVHILKVDRSLVAKHRQDLNATKVLQTVANLGKDLGLQIIAEGLEHDEEIDSLMGMGFEVAQGFGLAMPLELSKVRDGLDSGTLVPHFGASEAPTQPIKARRSRSATRAK